MILLGLHGLPRSGKDTVAGILMRRQGFIRLAFADPLKEAAAVLLNRPLSECHGIEYDREQVMPEWGFSMRWFLQRFGTECLRTQIRQDFWVHRLQVQINELIRKDPHARIVVTDARFQNELDMIRGLGGRVIEVRRPGLTASSHVSDQHYDCDWVLHNDGTLEDLQRKLEP